MTVHHHPSDETILACANGSLGAALSLAVGAHIDLCARCRKTIALAETMGGVFLDGMEPDALGADALPRALRRLDLPVAKPKIAATSPKSIDVALPHSLQHRPIGARRWFGPGIWVRSVFKDDGEGTRVYLLGAAPGKALLRHRHSGIEMTQVLEGEFFDGETRYGPGDFLETDAGHEHRPVTGAGATCICVIASRGVPRGLPGLLMRAFT